MAAYTYSNEAENRFWLQILGDLAVFLYRHIPEGQAEAEEDMAFFNRLEGLRFRALQSLDSQGLALLNRDAYKEVTSFRAFVLDIIRKMLKEGFFVSLKIDGMNMIVNLAEQYLYELYHFIHNKPLVIDPIDADLFWLQVMKEEARYMADQLDYFREALQKNAEYFMHRFRRFQEIATSLKGVYRTGINDYELTTQYRDELHDLLGRFADFINSLVLQQQKNLLPGTMSLLELDFGQRILCYYYVLQSYAAGKPVPNCKFSSKRMSTL